MTASLTRIAIVGADESDLGKVPGKTALELQAQASRRAQPGGAVKPKSALASPKSG